MPYNPKYKRGYPIPTIEVYARPMGYMQFQCPDCGRKGSMKQVDWRRAQVQCGRGCLHKFRVGLGFTSDCHPLTAMLAGTWNGYTNNKLEPEQLNPISGSIYGKTEWRCPNCLVNQAGYISKDTQELDCTSCGAEFNIILLIYKGAKAFRVIAPMDWILPHETKNLQPIPFETAGTI